MEKIAENGLGPEFGLLLRRKGIEEAKVKTSHKPNTFAEVAADFFQTEVRGYGRFLIPRTAVHALEVILQVLRCLQYFAKIECGGHFLAYGVGFEAGIAYISAALFGFDEAEQSIQACPEAQFNDFDLGAWTGAESGFDKNVLRLLYGSVCRMVALAQFGGEKGV